MIRDTLDEWVPVRLVGRADAERHPGDVHGAEGALAAHRQARAAGVQQRARAHAAREGVAGAAGAALARVGAHLVLAHRVGSTRAGDALILVRDTLRVGVADVVDRTGALLAVVDHLALSVDTARVLQLTKVDTGSLDAALGSLAVPAGGALHLLALHFGVALQALGAEADWAVVGDPALGRPGAPGAGQLAGVGALALVAHLLVPTVRVEHAARQARAAPAQVALGTRHAAATLLPTRARHTALATLAVLGGGALLDTHSVLALVALAAVCCLAAGVGQGQTPGQGVAGGGGRAGAEGLVVGDGALGALAALRAKARVAALGVDAGLGLVTLGVRGAARHAEPFLADVALAAVVIAVAERAAGALHADLVQQTVLVGGGAGDGALAAHTLEPGPALGGRAAQLHGVAAAPQRVPGQPGRTLALGLVPHHGAGGGAAAGVAGAGVRALVVDAALVLGTAGGAAAAQHAGHAAADLLAVAVIVHTTHRFAQPVVAHLVLATVVVVEADVLAELAGVADLSVRTLGVAGADLRLLDAGHGGGGVGDVALGAAALGAVVHHLALGVGATGRGAGVRAAVVDAGVGLGAVRVLPAAHNAHLVQAHVAQETVVVNTAGH